MTALSDAMNLPLYQCIADFSDVPGIGTIAAAKGDITPYLDDAADQMSECDDEGRDCRVFRMDISSGRISDVTADARAVIDRRRWQRGIAAE